MKVKVLIVSRAQMGKAIYGKLRRLDQIDWLMITPGGMYGYVEMSPIDLVLWFTKDDNEELTMLRSLFPTAMIITIGPKEEMIDFPFEKLVDELHRAKQLRISPGH
jgi:hypothetical protein